MRAIWISALRRKLLEEKPLAGQLILFIRVHVPPSIKWLPLTLDHFHSNDLVKLKVTWLNTNRISWTWTSIDSSLNALSNFRTQKSTFVYEFQQMRLKERYDQKPRIRYRALNICEPLQTEHPSPNKWKSSRLRLHESLPAPVKSRPLWSAGTPPSWRLHLPSSGALCHLLNQLEFFNDFSGFCFCPKSQGCLCLNLIIFEN